MTEKCCKRRTIRYYCSRIFVRDSHNGVKVSRKSYKRKKQLSRGENRALKGYMRGNIAHDFTDLGEQIFLTRCSKPIYPRIYCSFSAFLACMMCVCCDCSERTKLKVSFDSCFTLGGSILWLSSRVIRIAVNRSFLLPPSGGHYIMYVRENRVH